MGDSLLVLAKENRFTTIIQHLLLDSVSIEDIIYKDSTGLTLEHLLASCGEVETLEIIRDKYQAISNSPTQKNIHPIQTAAFEGHLKVIKFYEDLDPQLLQICNPVFGGLGHVAAQKNQTDILIWLASKYPKILKLNPTKKPFYKAIDCAIEAGSLDAIKILWTEGQRLDSESLNAAVRGGQLNIMLSIIQQTGIKPDMSHMLLAAEYGRIEIIQNINMLFAVPYINTEKNQSQPINISAKNHQWDAVLYLHEHGAHPFKTPDISTDHLMPHTDSLLDTIADKQDPQTAMHLVKAILNPDSPVDSLYCEPAAYQLKRLLLEDERKTWEFYEGNPLFVNVHEHSYVVPGESPYTVMKKSIERLSNTKVEPGDIAAAVAIQLKLLERKLEFKLKHCAHAQELQQAAEQLYEREFALQKSVVQVWKNFAQKNRFKKFREDQYTRQKTLIRSKMTYEQEQRAHERINPEIAISLGIIVQQVDKSNEQIRQTLAQVKVAEGTCNTLLQWKRCVFQGQAKARREAYKAYDALVKKSYRLK